tara:strand:+ start:284 stop:1189 length:906 start_codon:yes stop_codon:yes gene_type:complete
MGRSTKTFDRWKSSTKSTWTFQVFLKHNNELNQMVWANQSASKLVFETLSNGDAKWTDKASKHLKFTVPEGEETYENLKDWSNSYNQFHKWNNLNSLMALSASLETYISTVIELAITSDPGVLLDSPKSIDGIKTLKEKGRKNIFLEEIIINITKGDWNSRINSYEKYFGIIPKPLQNQIGNLEKVRVLRNNVGHAFGRDIKASRNHEVKKIEPMESLSDARLKKYQKSIWITAKSIDKHLLDNHICEYQAVAFYHRIYDGLRKDVHPSIRAMELKKRLGAFGDISGKEYCKGLVDYYENL